MVDILDVPESDLDPINIKDVDELRGRIQESLIETEPQMVEAIYDQWRVARDQLMRAKDLVDKASARLKGDLSTYFTTLMDISPNTDGTVALSIGDICDAVNDLTHFVIEGTENLAAKRSKRGSKRSQGMSIVRPSQEYVGKQTFKLLPDGRREISTLVEFIDVGGGHKVPKYRVETINAEPQLISDGLSSEVIIETEKEVTPKIQRPSLEENV